MRLPNEIKLFNDICSNIKQGEISNLYFVVGEEEYFKYHLTKLLENHAIDLSMKDFNLDILYSTEVTDNQVLNACLALPMMSDKRLVIVHDIDKLSISDPEPFIKYFSNPEQSTTAIFLANKVDQRKKIFQTLQKCAITIKSNPLKDESYILGWIKNSLEQKGYSLNDDALILFFEHLGENLFEIENQIEKLTIYKNTDKIINTQDIEDMTGVSKEYSVFQMINHLLERNVKKTIEVTKIILEQGQEPIAILAALYSRLIKQWQFTQLKRENLDDKSIASALKTSPYFLKDYHRVLKNYSSNQLKKSLQTIYRSDKKTKTSSADPKRILEFAVHEILQH